MKVFKHFRNGWQAESKIENVSNYDWEICTWKGTKGIKCIAQPGTFDEDGNFSFVMFQDESIDLCKEEGQRATEKNIKALHLKGLAIFDQLKEEEKLPIGKVKEGQTTIDFQNEEEVNSIIDKKKKEQEEKDEREVIEILEVIEDQAKPIYQKADRRKTTTLLKRHLKNEFGYTFSISTDVFSNGSSIDIFWNLGASYELMKSYEWKMQHSVFNSYEDMSEHKKGFEPMVLEGYELISYKYANTKRQISDEFKFKIAKLLSDNINCDEMFKLESFEQLHENFKRTVSGCWTWANIAYQALRNMSFPTDKENEITLLSVESAFNWQKAIITFECKGKRYKTDSLEPIDQISDASEISVQQQKLKKIQLIKYSEKSGAIWGDTKPLKDDFSKCKYLKFNSNLNIEGSKKPGYVFSLKRLEEVTTFCKNIFDNRPDISLKKNLINESVKNEKIAVVSEEKTIFKEKRTTPKTQKLKTILAAQKPSLSFGTIRDLYENLFKGIQSSYVPKKDIVRVFLSNSEKIRLYVEDLKDDFAELKEMGLSASYEKAIIEFENYLK